jgi:hypothetical protein
MVARADARGRHRVVGLGEDVVWFHFEGFAAGDPRTPPEALLADVVARHGRVLMLGKGWLWNRGGPAYREGCARWFMRRRSAPRANVRSERPEVR